MLRKTVLGFIWITFVSYTLWLAPLDHPDTWEFGRKLVTLHWGEINAYLFSIFWLMGVYPMIYACLMFVDGRMQPFRVWPYFVGANFTGVLCLLPYLLVRRRNASFWGRKDQWLSILDDPKTGQTLVLIAIALVGYALLAGDWRNFVYQFQTRPFVHLITLDFCLMGVIFPLTSLFDDDMARRGLNKRTFFGAVAWVPLFGPLFYLCYRPTLSDSTEAIAEPLPSHH